MVATGAGLSREELLSIQAECLADDIALDEDEMRHWTLGEVREYFESGGAVPTSRCLRTTKSNEHCPPPAESPVLPTPNEHCPPPAESPVLPTPNEHSPPAADDHCPSPSTAAPSPSTAAPEAGVETETEESLFAMSIRQLKALCHARGVGLAGCSEKHDLVRALLAGAQPAAPPSPPRRATSSFAVAREAASSPWDGISTKALREVLMGAGIDLSDCRDRGDFVALAERHELPPPTAAKGLPPVQTSPPARVEEMSTKELRRALQAAGIATDSCLERRDFVALAASHAHCLQGGNGASGEECGGEEYWEKLSTKELRALLAERHISTQGCLDRGDFLERARASRSVLLAAVAAAPSAAVAAEKPKTEDRKRVEAMLEALGGVVHGGYQVDLFGTKRGRCRQNTRCFRYNPANTKVNGCAMQGMGAVRCQRCGFANLDHEDLGQLQDGDPHLVDEKGNGWKFENDIQSMGVKLVPVPAPARNKADRLPRK
ncbi:hypothetical protein AB1Y20_002361 [Prymnesium parvum]|uniref:SAP domain-containing protein n=1 Tax=Prymnesium parvum TaxID=97485 RepID=A0AB34JBH5_PRYPA